MGRLDDNAFRVNSIHSDDELGRSWFCDFGESLRQGDRTILTLS